MKELNENGAKANRESGLELDKIELPALPSTEPKKPPKPQPQKKEKGIERPPEAKRVTTRVKLCVTAFVVLLVTITGILMAFSDKLNLSLPFFKDAPYEKPPTYVSVGPVLTSAGNGETIKMTVDINCKSVKLRKKITDMDNRIRNRIVLILQSPEANRLLQESDYVALRQYMTENIKTIMPGDLVKDIYISEFLRY